MRRLREWLRARRARPHAATRRAAPSGAAGARGASEERSERSERAPHGPPEHNDQGGQTLTEYSILMGVVGGGFAYTAIEFLPNFIDALQRYYDGFYAMLNLPFP